MQKAGFPTASAMSIPGQQDLLAACLFLASRLDRPRTKKEKEGLNVVALPFSSVKESASLTVQAVARLDAASQLSAPVPTMVNSTEEVARPHVASVGHPQAPETSLPCLEDKDERPPSQVAGVRLARARSWPRPMQPKHSSRQGGGCQGIHLPSGIPLGHEPFIGPWRLVLPYWPGFQQLNVFLGRGPWCLTLHYWPSAGQTLQSLNLFTPSQRCQGGTTFAITRCPTSTR